MAGSIFALLDDIAVLAKAAAASVDDVAVGAAHASAKAAGVVIDDAAVTPQYVRGITPARELPVVWRITKGSLRNKAVIIAVILALSVWAPWVFPWLLIAGGSYLAFEGAEKVAHAIAARRRPHPEAGDVAARTPADEDQIVASALRTDVVLSTEIMLISLAAIYADNWLMRAAILVVVAIIMTLGVYGVVGALIKFDDVGSWLMRKPRAAAQRVGSGLVRAMPFVFQTLGIVGVAAMLWIGGQILAENLDRAGWALPHHLLQQVVAAVPGPDALGWAAGTVTSMVLGLALGMILTGVAASIKRIVGRLRPSRTDRDAAAS